MRGKDPAGDRANGKRAFIPARERDERHRSSSFLKRSGQKVAVSIPKYQLYDDTVPSNDSQRGARAHDVEDPSGIQPATDSVFTRTKMEEHV